MTLTSDSVEYHSSDIAGTRMDTPRIDSPAAAA